MFSEIVFHSFSVSTATALFFGLLLLAVSAIISSSEVAFFSLTPQNISDLEESESRNAKKILQLTGKPQRLLATILIANNFVNVAIIMLLTFVLNSVIDFSVSPVLGFVSESIIITFLLLLFGEIMPKVYASQFPLKTGNFTIHFISVLQTVFKPFSSLLVNSTSVVNRRLVKKNKNNISINELSQALELTSDNEDEDKEILEGIIKFGNIRVVDIMTSRVDMVDVDIKTSYKKLLEIIIGSGYSRIPTYSVKRDNIKGILYSKDLLPHLDKPDNFRWQTLVRPAYYVPETKKIDDLLLEFQQNRVHLAIVVDEYGGTAGLVTLEDILEEIVGDISDEYDEEEQLFSKTDDHTYIFEAKIQLNDFFKIETIDENDFVKITSEVETLAGLILELKGEMPQKNETINFGKYSFEILSVNDRRIKSIKLVINE